MNEADRQRCPIRILVVDDHRVVRAGVAAYLDQIPDIQVVAEAADGREAINKIAVLEPQGNLPDVVLMDMVMPVLDGVSATREVRGRWPAVEIVAMTSFVEEATVRDALEAGAAGYLLKDADADQVSAAIRLAMAGQMHLDPTIARLLADSVRRPRRPDIAAFTPREKDVLVLLAQGSSNHAIAKALVVSERTARTHVSAILAKLGLASRTQAALWAVREKMLPDAD